MMAADGAPASGDVKPDTIPADTERATEMRAEKSVQEEAQEVVQEKQQETPQKTSAVEDTPALPPRPPPPAQQERPLPPSHDEKRASLQQPQIVRFAALPAPLHQHPQPLQAYQPGEEAPQLERPFFPRWHKFKIWAMLLSLAVSAVIFGVAITQCFINAPYMTALGFYPAEVQLGLSGTAAGLAILFCTTENLLICYSTLRRGMHPGWLVTYNLFIVIFGLISVITTGLYISVWFEDFGDYEYPTANPEWFDAAEKSITLQRVLCVFDCLLFAIHFVLLVGACVETHKLNKAKRKTIFIAVPTDGSQPEQVYQYAEPVQVSRLQSGPPPRNVQADGSQLEQGYYKQPQPGRIRWGPPAPRFQQPAPHGPIPPPQVIQYTGYYAPAPQEEPGFVPVVYQQPLQGYYAPPGPSRESNPPIRSSLRTPPPITGASGSVSGQTQ